MPEQTLAEFQAREEAREKPSHTPRLVITIPGEPVAQGRGKVGRWKAKDGREGITVRDPEKSRSWKGTAQIHMLAARPITYGWPMAALFRLSILVVFTCPKSAFKKRSPVPRRRAGGSRNDCDNLAKAVMDAGNGVLWVDDGQVAELYVEKWLGAQGEAPGVYVTVSVIDGPQATRLPEETHD
jgi:Holliday junction resolvase RusA-like endonuclease